CYDEPDGPGAENSSSVGSGPASCGGCRGSGARRGGGRNGRPEASLAPANRRERGDPPCRSRHVKDPSAAAGTGNDR
ncbi:MAG: hypothetical protein AVDCRST_MAG59-3614, partial [uncultured Thermomicrobiales bacterium]